MPAKNSVKIGKYFFTSEEIQELNANDFDDVISLCSKLSYRGIELTIKQANRLFNKVYGIPSSA